MRHVRAGVDFRRSLAYSRLNKLSHFDVVECAGFGPLLRLASRVLGRRARAWLNRNRQQLGSGPIMTRCDNDDLNRGSVRVACDKAIMQYESLRAVIVDGATLSRL